jgi:hypothetical protein
MTRPILTPIRLPAAAAVNTIDLPAHNYRTRVDGPPIAYRRASRLPPGGVLLAIVATLVVTAILHGTKLTSYRGFDSSELRLAAAMLDIVSYDVRP